MSGASSKRQQARNERALQDLIKSVPGNNVCADCQARNPGWASWSLGIFLCMRCAALHRKLGTHITKVKSLSMDSWSTEQNMKRIGNVASNRIYNPQNTRPPIPFDADEADSAMERFIRGKYTDKAAKPPTRHHTGSTNSDDQPPPLPPKPGSRFGFRSASSIFPLSSKSRREAAAKANYDHEQQRTPSPPPRNKPSRVFGTPVGAEGMDELDMKLAKLRDMGFRDEKRNTAVLKGLSGNLEKSIETLVRLGEGSGASKVLEVAAPPPVRSRTPVGASAGLTINRRREEIASPTVSSNPFDMLDAPQPIAQPQSSQSTGGLASPSMGNPYQQAQNPNPFGLAPSQSQYNLNQAFQNMSVQPSQQPLFPNHTGGFPAPQPPSHQQLYQQSMTPPVPTVPQQYHQPVIYENPSQQPQAQQNYNPFMQQQQPQAPPINTNFASNPFNQQLATPQSLYQSPMAQSPAQQYGASFFNNGATPQQPQLQQHPPHPQQQMNPYLNQSNAPQQMNPFYNDQSAQQPQQSNSQPGYDYSAQYQQQRQQTYPQVPQQSLRADKRSIMDLYNYPQPAPAPTHAEQDYNQSPAQSQYVPAGPDPSQQPRSVSSPHASYSAASKNPFAPNGGGPVQQSFGQDTLGQMGQFAPAQNGSRHVSQESVNIDAGGWTNGRHSPDAWGSISARNLR